MLKCFLCQLGAGYAAIVCTLVITCYYNVIMSYVIFYFVHSFTSGLLPWATCTNSWNTDNCLDYNNATLMRNYNSYKEFLSSENRSGVGATYADFFGNKTYRSPSDEYFQ